MAKTFTCTPMAEAKRQRLQRLRSLLQDPEFCSRSIAELMTASGLLACGATAIDYRQRFGESPRHSRSR
jgi:transcriptional regulator GlxA family with amidase domain